MEVPEKWKQYPLASDFTEYEFNKTYLRGKIFHSRSQDNTLQPWTWRKDGKDEKGNPKGRWRRGNQEFMNKKQKISYNKHAVKRREEKKTYREKIGKEEIYRRSQIQYKKNRLRYLQEKKVYFQNNKEKIYKSRKNRYKNNENFRLACRLRGRLNDAIRRNSKANSALVLLGCSIEELKTHLQSKWEDWMSWDNYGKGDRTYDDDWWVIDHIKPCAAFDMSNPEEQQKCFHFSNLQPLHWIENGKKGDKWDECEYAN